jgi:hypothetical protein
MMCRQAVSVRWNLRSPELNEQDEMVVNGQERKWHCLSHLIRSLKAQNSVVSHGRKVVYYNDLAKQV